MMSEVKIREFLDSVAKDYPEFGAKLIRTNSYVYVIEIVERSTGFVYNFDVTGPSATEAYIRAVFSEASYEFKVKLKGAQQPPAKKPRCYDIKAYEKITTYGLF